MDMTNTIAFVSRKIARSRYRKLSVGLFRYYPAKSGVTTIRDFDGDLAVTLDRSSYISSAIYWCGYHSYDVGHFVRDFLKPDMVFADIGANLGELTLIAAKRLTNGKVLSFEPSPELFAQLSRNVALNDFNGVTLYNLGLFDQPGSLPLFLREDHPYGTSNDGVSSLFSRGRTRQESTVSLRRLDDVAEESGLMRLDLMKIDVEGAELMVLRGAERCLLRFRPVITAEISESNFRTAGYSREDLFAYLRSMNYEVPSPDGVVRIVPPECDAICFPRELKRPIEILASR